MHKTTLLTIVLIFFWVLFLKTEYAKAQQNTSLAISPAIIEVNLKPGQIKNNKITITNTGKTALGVGISLNQVTPKEAQGLAVELKKPDWIRLSDQTILLNAGESREIEIITSPNNKTPPGGYYAMVYFQAAIPFSDIKLGATTAIPKLGAFMLITVQGKTDKKYELIKNVDYPLVTSTNIPETAFTLKNTGNVHLIPAGYVELNRVGKNNQYKQGFPPTVILPSTTRQVKIPSIQNIALGIYKVNLLSLNDNILGYEKMKIGYIIVIGKFINLAYAAALLPVLLSILFVLSKRKKLRQALKTLTQKTENA